ncbi:wall-associated receptor kinase 17-like [Silene latifolia]|uniref:wall-associated receptor kinase 17-like n=1 Tax=Silene latifolia TaxID=37657 RepID=UPI003D7742FD
MDDGGSQPITIFTQKELKRATNNFKDDCIAGRGGSGIVYKGILEDKSLIAIKKAIVVDENQIDQFINELLILSQLNHKNVVKLLGCCLDVEVPLLIYEFVPNGALFNHIHNVVHGSWINWRHCLRIVYEIADALAYLHSAANCPVIHRDIKSANILLDENYTAKISDFGGSRLIPLDQTKWATAVQGTLGYLDPEYLFSSQLTEKSDVYSFGVLVAELLTRKKAVYQVKGSEFRNLATDFVELMNMDQVVLILEPRLVTEAPIKEIEFLVELVGQCLSSKGEDRPTMKNVVALLDRLVSRVLSC